MVSKNNKKKTQEVAGNPKTLASSTSRTIKTKTEMDSRQNVILSISKDKERSETKGLKGLTTKDTPCDTFTSTSHSSSFRNSSEYNEIKVISSIDLLESDKKEPVLSVPIDVISDSLTSETVSRINKHAYSSSQMKEMAENTVIVLAESTQGKNIQNSTSSTSSLRQNCEMTSSSSKLIANEADRINEAGFKNALYDSGVTGASNYQPDMKSPVTSALQQKQQNRKSSYNDETVKTSHNTNKMQASLFSTKQHKERTSKTEVYDSKTRTWNVLDDKNISLTFNANKKQPTYERYVSRDSDGTCKITYKKKISY